MVGPVATFGPSGSSRYAIPDYSPIAKGLSSIGDNLGWALRERIKQTQKDAKDKQLSEIMAGGAGVDAPLGGPEGPGSSRATFDPMAALARANAAGLGGDPAVLGAILKQHQISQLGEDQGERFETVDDPYGRGGVGQRSTKTGKIVGYQGPPTPEKLSEFRDKLAAMGFTDPTAPGYAEAARKLAMRPGTTIDARQMGTIPADHRAVYDAQGRITHYEVIPGSPTARKIAAAEAKAGGRADTATERASIVNQHVGAVRKMVADESFFSPVTGMGGSLMANVPASKAHDMQQRLATLKALVGFKQLNEMRAQSPTGGALGNVTERELGFLQSVIGSLEQSQSREQFLENLALVEQAFNRVIDGPPPAGPQADPRQYAEGGGVEAVMQSVGLPGLNPVAPPGVDTTRPPATAATIDPRFFTGVGTVPGPAPGAAPSTMAPGFDPQARPPAGPARFSSMDLSGLKAEAANAASMSDADYAAYLARLNAIAGR